MFKPFSTLRSPTLQAVAFAAGIFTLVVGLAVLWEFGLEDTLMASGDPGWRPESFAVHLEYVLTVAAFTFIALIPSTITLHNYIVRRDAAERSALHMATHDPLTGLANRGLLLDRLDHTIAHHDRNGGQFALVCLDLNNFKTVNDLLGHEAGDHVLRTVAERLKTDLRKTDSAARMGGDEFAVIVSDLKSTQQLSVFVEKLKAVIERPIHFEGKTLTTDAAVGFSVCPDQGRDADSLINLADMNMRAAKTGDTLRADNTGAGAARLKSL